jgi:tetratricopeptide (TPR) repeat protein
MPFELNAYTPAFQSYQETLRIQLDHFGADDNIEIASTFSSIGLVLFKQGAYGLAKNYFTDSLRIRLNLHGTDLREGTLLWYNIATIRLKQGEVGSAIKSSKRLSASSAKHLSETITKSL